MVVDVSNILIAKSSIRDALRALEKEEESVQKNFFIHSMSLMDASLRQLDLDEQAFIDSFGEESDTEN